jgi:serine phosphatase RsbU (regulator of sigma subunit)
VPFQPRKPAPGSRYQPQGYQGQAGRRGLPAHNQTGSGRRQTSGHAQMKPIRRPLPPELLKRIDTDPLFAVMTGDQQWINPFTGEPVNAATNGRAETARAHLVENTSWRDKEVLPRMQLEVVRWRIDLMRLLPVEPRLRIFGRDGRWLNPFTGDLVSDIVREEGKITAHTITAMARVLCSCPEAMSGRLLDSQTLSAKIQQLGIGTGSNPATGQARETPGSSALSADMVKARSVQQNMLADLPTVEGYEFGVHFTPHSGVSGDFYEVITLKSGRLMFVIGDVSGHGMQAALVVATALKTLRFLARNTSNVGTLLVQFNDEIRPDLLPGQFITLFVAELDPVTGSLSCIRAGHHAGVMVSADGDVVVRKVGRQGMAIGLAAGPIFAGSMHAEVVHLQPGDVLMQYTDGLTEGMNADSVEYGETRLYASLFTHIGESTQGMVDGMAKDLLAHVGGQLDDDLTIFAISMLPKAEDMASSGEWDQMEPPAKP